MRFNAVRRIALVLLCLLSLGGCKEVLFSNLDETEANEMVTVLAAAGVSASRTRDKDNIYEILVDTSHIPVATTLLRKNGYPKPKFETLGDVFSAEGIVGTPFEQHARYIYAMNEELSHTISSIDGIKSARVFVTSPPKDRYARTAPPASASVMINYEPGFDAKGQVSKVKNVIAHSMVNLAYDDVAVALFQTTGPSVQIRESDPSKNIVSASLFRGAFIGSDVMEENISLIVLGGLCVLMAIFLVLWYRASLMSARAAGRGKP